MKPTPRDVGPRPAALLGRPRHLGDAALDPGALRRRGGHADGQPGPAGRGLGRGARQGAATSGPSTRSWWTPARSSPATTCCRRSRRTPSTAAAIRCSPRSGGPLIAKLAVEHARATGCDTVAHGCTGKGNDQVRIEATVATLDPELKVIAPGARVADGPRGGDRLRARARDPGQGRHRGAARTRSTTTSGGAPRRGARSRTSPRRRADDVFQLVTRPEEAPDEPQLVRVGFEPGCPVSLDGERLDLVELIERAAELGRRHGVGIVDQHRGPHRRPEDPRPLRGAGGGDRPGRAPRAREARLDDPPEQLQAGARGQVGLPLLRGPLARAAARGPRRLHGVRQRATSPARSR